MPPKIKRLRWLRAAGPSTDMDESVYAYGSAHCRMLAMVATAGAIRYSAPSGGAKPRDEPEIAYQKYEERLTTAWKK